MIKKTVRVSNIFIILFVTWRKVVNKYEKKD